MSNPETSGKAGTIWRSKNGDLYYVKISADNIEYCKIYEIEGDEIFCRDQNGNKIAVRL